MSRLILKRETQEGRLALLASSDAKHFYLAMQVKDWAKPVFRQFHISNSNLPLILKELRSALPC